MSEPSRAGSNSAGDFPAGANAHRRRTKAADGVGTRTVVLRWSTPSHTREVSLGAEQPDRRSGPEG